MLDLNERYTIAHRGAFGLCEFGNTKESFDEALKYNPDFIEFDVRITKDKVLICYHDRYIKGKLIKSLNFNEVQKIANDKGFSILTFEETVNYLKNKVKLDIEIKEVGYENKVIEIVSNLNYDQYIIKSFKSDCVKKIKKLDSNIQTGLLIGERISKSNILNIFTNIFPYFRIKNNKVDFIAVNHNLLIFGYIKRIKFFHKIPIFTWTVNDKEKMIKLYKKGMNGIITDRIDILEKVKNC